MNLSLIPILSLGERDQVMGGALMVFCAVMLILIRRPVAAAIWRHAKSLPEVDESWWQLRFKPTERRVKGTLWAIIAAALVIGLGNIAAGVF